MISSLAFFLPFFLTISIWAGRNYFVFGTFSTRSDTGYFVLSKGIQCEYNRQRLAELTKGTVYIFSRRLGEFIWPDYKIDYNKIMCSEEAMLTPRRAKMMKEGLNPFRIDKIYLKEGIGKITRHPFRYLYVSLLSFIWINSMGHLPPAFDRLAIGNVLVFAKGIYFLIYLLMIPLVILGFIASLKNQKSYFILLLVIYINLVHSLLCANPEPRYNLPVLPFYIILGAVGIMKIFEQKDKDRSLAQNKTNELRGKNGRLDLN